MNIFPEKPLIHPVVLRCITLFISLFYLSNNLCSGQDDSLSVGDGGISPMAACPGSEIYPSELSLGASGGVRYVDLYTECSTYTVTENLDWVSCTKSGFRITVNVSANTGSARTGIVTIGGLPLYIDQACGVPGGAGTISGTNSVCRGQAGVSYSVAPITGATGYQWTLPSGATIASGSNTNSITVNYSSSAVSGNITVRGTGCGTGSPSPNFYVTVNTLGEPGTITGPANVCRGSTYTYSIPSVTGASSYSWTLPSGASGSSSTNTINVTFGSGSGSVTVRAHNSAGCSSSTTSSRAVTVATLTPYPVTGDATICSGTSTTVELHGSQLGIKYRLYLNGSFVSEQTGAHTPLEWQVSAAGTYTVIGRTEANCDIPMTGSAVITVRPRSTAATSINNSVPTVCRDINSSVLTATGGSLGYGANWYWYANNPNSASVFTGNPYTVSPSSTTTYYVKAIGACDGSGTGAISTIVNVITPPVISQHPSNVTVCAGDPASFTVSAHGAASYQWQHYIGGTWTNISGATGSTYNIPSTAGMNGRDFRCVVKGPGPCNFTTPSTSARLSFSYLYPYTVYGTATICPGQDNEITLDGSSLDTRIWYRCYLNGNQLSPPVQATGSDISFGNRNLEGTYTVMGINLDGCEVPMNGSAVVTMRDISTPPSSITADPPSICPGESSTLTINGGSLEPGYGVWKWYSGTGPCGSISKGSGVTSITVNPETTTTYYVRAEGGCEPTLCVSITVTVKEALQITSHPANSTISPGQNTSFSVSATGLNLSYQWQSSINANGPWTDLTGSTAIGYNTPSLTVQAPALPGVLYYRCHITSDCGIQYSGSACLTVTLPDAGYLTAAEIPGPEGRELNTSLPVGYTQGSYNTSAYGAATYEIPVFIPQGTGGMQPSLSLFYSSLGGNGLTGMGWSIKGLSTITRINKPYYVDGKIAAINLNGSDLYALDGNMLVLTGDASGYDGDVYKTELETFAEITSRGASGNGPAWFEVKLRNGSVIRYGSGENSVVKANDGSVLIWNITRITDPAGNYCEYIYHSDPMAHNYLEKILYTGNDNTNLQPYNEIRFYYKQRSDKNELYFPGLSVPQKLILTGIECISEENTLRSYEFKYADDLYSHLVELIEKGKNGAQLNSTIFDWGENSSVYRVKKGDYLNPGITAIYTGDFNGDGNADILTTPTNTTSGGSHQWKLYLGSQTGYELIDSGYLDPYFIRFCIADGDNDGDDDIYWQSNKEFEVDCPEGLIASMNPDSTDVLESYLTEKGDTFQPEGEPKCFTDANRFEFYFLQNNRMTADASRNITFIDEYDILEMYPADFNGDGITDYLFVDESRNFKYSRNLQVSSVPDLDSPERIFLIDFNGDGKTDLATTKNNGSLRVLQYNVETHSFDILLGGHPIRILTGIGDFNGDGKTDFLSQDNYYNRKTYIYYSTGDDLIETTGPITANLTPEECPPLVEPFPVNYICDINLEMVVNDFNGDGKSDIFKAKFETTRSRLNEGHSFRDTVRFYESIYLSSGTGFREVHVNDGIGRHGFTQLDNNHDGNADLVLSLNWEDNEIFEFFADDRSQLLSSVTDGRNLKTEFSYNSMLDPDVYSREPETYPPLVFPVAYPEKLVSGITVYDNNNGLVLEKTKYKYTNLKMHRQGKGVLGFSKVLSRNLTTGRSNLSRYSYDNTFYNPYLSGSTDSINGHIVSEVTAIRAFITFDGNSRYLPYNDTSVRTDNINETSAETTRTLDTSGNVTGETVRHYDAGHTLVKQVSSGFSGYNAFGLPDSVSVSNTRGGETITRTQSINYKPVTGLTESVTQSFGESQSLTTTYGYDDFGNNTSVISVSGGKTRRSATLYETGKGRFPVKKINALNDTLKYTYDGFGNILTMTDISGLVTSYDYDHFGNLQQTTLPDLRTITDTLTWSPDAEDIGELYYRQTESTGKPVTKEYYDILGRKKRTKTQSFDGRWLQADVDYDQAGRIVNSYSPDYAGSPATRYVHYLYDDYGRVKAETYFPQDDSVTYSYDPLKITVAKAGRSYEKEYDATGLLIASTDPGGTISYLYNPEDKVRQITSPSGSTVIEYDDYGFQSSLEDIDAGTISYDYNAFGELESQTDAEGNHQTLTYDALGRMLTRSWTGGEMVTYVYNPVNRMIKSISSSGGTRKRFEYDTLDRLRTRVDSIDNNNKFTAVYSYDNQSGEIENVLLNSSVQIDYEYNNYGYLREVSAGAQTIWTATSMNEYGVVNNFTLGNGATTSLSYDPYGFIDGITTVKSGTYLQNWSYDFDNITGNLTSRTGLNSSGGSITEGFTYDNLDRLWTYSIGQDTLSVNYDPLGRGNITGKTDVGIYNYDLGVHNVSSVTDLAPLAEGLPEQEILYTKFNKVSYIEDFLSSSEERELAVTYGPDEERVKTVYTVDNVPVKTKYFALGQYEKEVDSSGNIRELYYISASGGAVAVLERKGGQDTYYYIHKDHLGSVDVITKPDGTVKERYNYDPWGRRRNPADWSYNNIPTSFFIDRGFTGHEHLDQFGLINMNGRVYDPLMAMFLSPDNYVQAPDFTQNFNRYAYCLNNPLNYVDLSGNCYMKYIDMTFENSPIWEPVRTISTGRESRWEPGGGSKTPTGDYLDSWFRNPVAQSQFSTYSEFDMTIQKNGGYFWFSSAYYIPGGEQKLVDEYGYNMPGSTFTIEEKIWVTTPGNNPSGGGGNFDDSNLALDIGGGIYGGLRTAVTPGDQWLGKNGKYYSNSWGGNRYTGSRSGAFAASNTYKWAGRATIGASAVIGGIQVYNGYQMDGGQFGYNANLAGASATGSIVGGLVGAKAGASIGFAIGVWFGGVGAVPGTIIGGFVGGIAGSLTGNKVGEASVNYYYGR